MLRNNSNTDWLVLVRYWTNSTITEEAVEEFLDFVVVEGRINGNHG